MYNRITVIGIGTLGGFLCKNITDLDCIKELVIVDFDIVELKNTFTSVYESSYIGEYKVDALEEIIDKDVNIIKLNTEYKENVTKIPESDLIIDCRDVVCNRKNEIDVRLYISDKSLIIDGRRTTVNQKSYNGEYSIELKKSEIIKAAYFAAQLIESKHIEYVIKNNLIQRIDLNLLSTLLSQSIYHSLSNRVDMVYEATGTLGRIHCLSENIKPILNLNHSQDLDIFIGEKEKGKIIPFPKKSIKKKITLPKGSLENANDLINKLCEIISCQSSDKNYLITVQSTRKGVQYIELLEETGAA